MSFSTKTGEFLGKKVVSFFLISEFFKDQVVIVDENKKIERPLTTGVTDSIQVRVRLEGSARVRSVRVRVL